MADDREQKVRERAYQLWEQEGRPQGRHDDHWGQADSEFGKTGPEGLLNVGITPSEDVPEITPAPAKKPRAARKPR